MDSPSPTAAECPWPLLTDSSESNGSSSSCSNSDDYSGPSLSQPWGTSNQEDVGESGLTAVNPPDLMPVKRSSGEVAANHGSPQKPKTHACSICGLEFAIGQALGGHMRRHRAANLNGNTQNSSSSGSSPDSSPSKRVLLLDLNLTPLENDLEIFKIEKAIALVDCFY